MARYTILDGNCIAAACEVSAITGRDVTMQVEYPRLWNGKADPTATHCGLSCCGRALSAMQWNWALVSAQSR